MISTHEVHCTEMKAAEGEPITWCRQIMAASTNTRGCAEGGHGGELGLCGGEGRPSDLPEPAALHGGAGVRPGGARGRAIAQPPLL